MSRQSPSLQQEEENLPPLHRPRRCRIRIRGTARHRERGQRRPHRPARPPAGKKTAPEEVPHRDVPRRQKSAGVRRRRGFRRVERGAAGQADGGGGVRATCTPRRTSRPPYAVSSANGTRDQSSGTSPSQRGRPPPGWGGTASAAGRRARAVGGGLRSVIQNQFGSRPGRGGSSRRPGPAPSAGRKA